MYLALGYHCNHHCFFCPRGQEKRAGRARTEDILVSLQQGVAEQGISHVTLSGGEPTLHPDFPLILSRCVELGARVTVLTNGDSLHDQQFARRCFEDINPAFVSVVSAIHSDTQQSHARVTGVKGSFSRTVQGLKNLIPLGIPFTVKQCVSAWNYQRLPQFADFVFREFGPYASMTVCGMDFCGMTEEETDAVAVGYRKMGPYIEAMLDCVIGLRQKFGAFPLMTVADLPLCTVDPFYWQFYVQTSRGNVARYSAPAGDGPELENSLHVVNDCDTFFEACRSCDANQWCPGVWWSAYQYFGEDEATPVAASF